MYFISLLGKSYILEVFRTIDKDNMSNYYIVKINKVFIMVDYKFMGKFLELIKTIYPKVIK
jgi:hypothetical protein